MRVFCLVALMLLFLPHESHGESEIGHSVEGIFIPLPPDSTVPIVVDISGN